MEITRIAFFVEGQTEQIFINRLVRNILGSKSTNIIQKKIKGGTNAPKEEITRHLSLSRMAKYEILIIDCGSDNRVKSEVMENTINLIESNYKHIVGLRDLYPIPEEESERLEKGLNFLPPSLKKYASHIHMVLVVQEIETWFLGEINHYRKVDKRLTGEFILRKLGFDPYTIDPKSRIHPSEDLNDIYKLVGKSYTKKYNQTNRIVNSLDIRYIKNTLRYKLKSLDKLITLLESMAT